MFVLTFPSYASCLQFQNLHALNNELQLSVVIDPDESQMSIFCPTTNTTYRGAEAIIAVLKAVPLPGFGRPILFATTIVTTSIYDGAGTAEVTSFINGMIYGPFIYVVPAEQFSFKNGGPTLYGKEETLHALAELHKSAVQLHAAQEARMARLPH